MADTTFLPPINPLQPGVYSSVDASALQQQGDLSGLQIPAIVGTALGGQPNTPLFFRNQQALKSVLRGGPAYDAARLALSQLNGPPVCVVRVGNSISKASITLTGDSGGDDSIVLTSKDWGAWANSIYVTVAADNKVTIDYTDDFGLTYTEVFDGGSGATAAALVDLINGKVIGKPGSRFVDAEVGEDGTMPLDVAARTALTGGADGSSPASGDWTNGFTALETVEVDIVVPATGDATVHAQALTHCKDSSLPLARRERVCFAGGVAGESISTVVTARLSSSLRDPRFKLVYPGFVEVDAQGNETLRDPFYLAALAAGQVCALSDPAASLMHRPVPITDVEKRLARVQGGDLDTLLAAGISPVEPAPRGGFRWVDDITTYNQDQFFRDGHVIRSLDYVSKRLRTALEEAFVGGKSLVGTAGDIAVVTNAEADELVNEQVLRAHGPAQVTEAADGSYYTIGLPVQAVGVNRFLFLNVVLQPPGSQIATTE